MIQQTQNYFTNLSMLGKENPLEHAIVQDSYVQNSLFPSSTTTSPFSTYRVEIDEQGFNNHFELYGKEATVFIEMVDNFEPANQEMKRLLTDIHENRILK